MDINDLKTFLEVNRTRHFARAADNLCVTQSTVSARIRNLEDQLGNKVFIRERNNLQLTAAGEKLIQYAEMIVNSWRRAQQELGASSEGQASLVVAGVPSLWDVLIQDWLCQLYDKRPELMIYAEQHAHEVLLKRIINNTLDIAFVYDAPLDERLAVTKLEDIALVMVSTEPESQAQRVVHERYILVDWGVSYLKQHADFFQDAARPMIYFGAAQHALQFLRKVGGSAYLALPQVQALLEQGELFRVEGAPEYARTAYALTNRANDKFGLVQELLASFHVPVS